MGWTDVKEEPIMVRMIFVNYVIEYESMYVWVILYRKRDAITNSALG